MAFIPTTPETGNLVIEEEKTLDVFQIHALHIELDPGNLSNARCVVEWSRGFMTGDVYTAVIRHTDVVQGAGFLAEMARDTTGNSLYDEVKASVWKLLDDDGKLPAGTIS
jgi:hypothetical protein